MSNVSVANERSERVEIACSFEFAVTDATLTGFADHLVVLFEGFPAFFEHFERGPTGFPHRIHETLAIGDRDRCWVVLVVFELLGVLLVGVRLPDTGGNDTREANLDIQMLLHVRHEFLETPETEVTLSGWFDRRKPVFA